MLFDSIENPSAKQQIKDALAQFTPELFAEYSAIKETTVFGPYKMKFTPEDAKRFATMEGMEAQLRDFKSSVGLLYYTVIGEGRDRFQIKSMPVRLDASR